MSGAPREGAPVAEWATVYGRLEGPRSVAEVTLASGERATLATYFSHGSWWCEWPAYAYGTTPLRAALFFVANCTNWLVVGLREVAS